MLAEVLLRSLEQADTETKLELYVRSESTR